ncbi:TPA: hypothetical protein BOS_3585 [Bos taurus]|nr:TPA: hypothetical protein BOS_3585 [Bos taurus]
MEREDPSWGAESAPGEAWPAACGNQAGVPVWGPTGSGLLALLLLRGAVDHGPVQAAAVGRLLVHSSGGGRAVAHEIAEGVVHGRPEAKGGHQASGGVGSHEGQAAAVRRRRRVGQAQGAEAERRAQRVGAGVGAEVTGVGLQWREGRATAQRAQSPGRHGAGQQRSVVRRCSGARLQRRGEPRAPGGRGVHAAWPRVVRGAYRPHCGLVWGYGGAEAGRQAPAVVVEHLLDGLHHVAAAALQHQLQDAPPVAREDARQDVQRQPDSEPKGLADPGLSSSPPPPGPALPGQLPPASLEARARGDPEKDSPSPFSEPEPGRTSGDDVPGPESAPSGDKGFPGCAPRARGAAPGPRGRSCSRPPAVGCAHRAKDLIGRSRRDDAIGGGQRQALGGAVEQLADTTPWLRQRAHLGVRGYFSAARNSSGGARSKPPATLTGSEAAAAAAAATDATEATGGPVAVAAAVAAPGTLGSSERSSMAGPGV